jgi:hypothetical protein
MLLRRLSAVLIEHQFLHQKPFLAHYIDFQQQFIFQLFLAHIKGKKLAKKMFKLFSKIASNSARSSLFLKQLLDFSKYFNYLHK